MAAAADELEERRSAEIEFVSCAFGPDEAWCDRDANGLPAIHRRLKLPCHGESISLLLTLVMPLGYPASEGLAISCSVDDAKDASLARTAYKAVPKLVEACRDEIVMGEESVFLVLTRAEEWIADNWDDYCSEPIVQEALAMPKIGGSTSVTLGRRLIYSHHIISKIKRSDIKQLASQYKLTGYLKIGWPGLILIEGAEDDCLAFYDEIRPWCWKFLVVRGEQQEQVREIEANRKFVNFVETDDMSLVAQRCREVGLEALFRTAMKVYSNNDEKDDGSEVTAYGALVHVDHMNNNKCYRKWLRKAAKECECLLLLKQTYPNHDFSKRPFIVVAVVGDASLVQQFLKRWRTSRVDVDSKGKPCLERMMKVLIEGPIDNAVLVSVNWDGAQAEENVNVLPEQLLDLVASIGGNIWKDSLLSLRMYF